MCDEKDGVVLNTENREIYERCEVTGKRCLSYKVAHSIVKRSKHSKNAKHNSRGIRNTPCRLYHCDCCGMWHVTHQSYADRNKHTMDKKRFKELFKSKKIPKEKR